MPLNSVRKYIELALQYPKLSTDTKKKEDQLHEWFAMFVLLMLQELLLAYRQKATLLNSRRRDLQWEQFAERQIKLFREDIELLQDELDDYGPDVSALVKRILKS